MKKYLFYVVVVPLIFVTALFSIPFIIPAKKFPEYSDTKLREIALSRGLKSTPTTLNELKKLLDSPDNPITLQKISLGEELFFDTNLSKNRATSCATCHSFDRDLQNKGAIRKVVSSKNEKFTDCAMCHLQDQSGVDRFTSSVGDNGIEHPQLLNTQTVLNASLAKYFTWNAEVKSLEEQSANSIMAHHKMNLSPKELEERLNSSKYFVDRFQETFGEKPNINNSSKAIAVYLKTLITRGSYDKFLDGDDNAISSEAKRGMANFINFGCKGCHTGMSLGGQSIQRFPVRRVVLASYFKMNLHSESGANNSLYEFPFENKGGFLGKNNQYLFRVPILRNVAKTSPYFHNGAVPKLREAVEIMAKYQTGRYVSDEQIDEIVAFLRTLNGDLIDYKKAKGDDTL